MDGRGGGRVEEEEEEKQRKMEHSWKLGNCDPTDIRKLGNEMDGIGDLK